MSIERVNAAGFLERWEARTGSSLWLWGTVLVLLGALYGGILGELIPEWWHNPNYSHGFLVPPAAAYLVWQRRAALSRWQPRPSLWGLAGVVGALAVLLVGYLGAEFFLQRFSFLLLLAGTIVFFWGWKHLRALAFPLALLALAIPLPAIIFNALTLPLQLIASQWAEVFLRVCEVPVFREGNILILANQVLSVTEACSGVRSLVSLLTLGLIISSFLAVSFLWRGLFVLSALPITLFANAARVAGTGLLGQYWGQEAAEGFFHTFSSWLVFLAAFGLLFVESLAIERMRKRRTRREEP